MKEERKRMKGEGGRMAERTTPISIHPSSFILHPSSLLRIGVDFDNTIVCYDEVFHRVAFEQGLIPASVPVSKGSVRAYLRSLDQEDAWTAMQGYVYGVRMIEAPAFPGVLGFFRRLVQGGASVFIVSHKTRYPYLGPKYDLHRAALEWLEKNGFFAADRIGLPPDRVFLELTKQQKLERIGALACTHFIDDLPEFLAEPTFPHGVQRLLFDPQEEYPDLTEFPRARSWSQLHKELLAA